MFNTRHAHAHAHDTFGPPHTGAGHHVTVFEGGRAPGGRSSTRRTRQGYQFDHGATYIGTPKSAEFAEAVREWSERGFLREWSGRFYRVAADGTLEQEHDTRFVGYPQMGSVCEGLLSFGGGGDGDGDGDGDIELVFETRANAVRHPDGGGWMLSSAKDGRELGMYDWLVCSDRLSAMAHRADLAEVSEFKLGVHMCMLWPATP